MEIHIVNQLLTHLHTNLETKKERKRESKTHQREREDIKISCTGRVNFFLAIVDLSLERADV